MSADAQLFSRYQTFVSLLQLLGGPLAGRICDKFGFMPTLVLSQLSAALSYVLLAASSSVLTLFLSQCPTVFMHNMHAAQAATTILCDENMRAVSMGRLSLSYGIGMVLGSYCGGRLSEAYSNQHTAVLGAVLSIMIVPLNVYLFRGIKNPDVEKNDKRSGLDLHSIADMLRQASVKRLVTVQLLLGLAVSIYRSTFSQTMREHMAMGIFLTYPMTTRSQTKKSFSNAIS